MKKAGIADRHPFLAALSESDYSGFRERSETRKYRKNQQIVRVLDNDTNLYLIDSGSVRVTLFSSDGKEISFVDLEAGGNFGELSAIDGKPRSANVIALSNVEITMVPPALLLDTLKKYPEISIDLLRQLASIIRRLCDRIFEYSTLDACNRIHLELLRIGAMNMDLDGIARIDNPPTQTELASRVSCTREAVSREYKKLENLGIIRRPKKRLVIEEYRQLQEMAGINLT